MSTMSPDLLVRLAAIVMPLLAALMLAYEMRRRRQRLASLGDAALIARLLPGGATRSRATRAMRLGVASTCAAVALWGPRWGTERRARESEGADVVLAVDVSRSMLAGDEKPSRLDHVRQEIRKLRSSSRTHRLGLVAFAGRSYVLAPLTTDGAALELFLDNLGPDLVGQPGSAIGPALRQGTDLLIASRSAADRALVIMTDGETFESPEALVSAARYAKDAEVKVIAMGFGTEAGAAIPEMTDHGRDWHRDREGVVVVSKAHPEALETIAKESGGVAIPPSTRDRTSALRGALEDLKTAAHTENGAREQQARFQWFLLPALLLLFWDAAAAGWRPRRAAVATAVLLVVGARNARAEDAGLRAYRAGRFAEAVASWRTAIKAGDERLATRYNLGTALLAAGQIDSAIAVLDPLSRLVTGDLRTRTLFNLGLAHLDRARAPQGDPGSYALAADCYRRVLLAESANADAKYNYELAHRRKQGA